MKLEVKKLNVLNDNILVRAIRIQERGGIVTGITGDDKPEVGEVLQVGPGRTTDTGEVIATKVEVGMVVLFNQHTTTKFNIDGKTYYTLREEDCIAYQE